MAGALPLVAQTVAPDTTPKSEETLVLSPFEVNAEDDNGYQATQTLAGTRIRTDLKDVGSAITVVTKQFMQDIGATDNSSLLQYTPNAEVAGTRGTYAGLGNATSVDETNSLRQPGSNNRVRGLATADNTRDYFITDIPWDSYNVDRVDIQRGPNAILFGLGSPAGIVNASLNGASFRNQGNVTFRIGSYGSQRASLDVNQSLIKDVLAIRVDGLWDKQKYQQDPAYQDDKRVYAALRFDPKLFGPSFHTSLKVKYENGDIKANRPRTTPPQDSITPWFRPINLDPNNLEGGMGKLSIPNGYTIGSAASTYSPWLGGGVININQQQPGWFIDGTTNQLYRIYGGYVNTGALSATGVPQGTSSAITGQRYGDVFTALTNFNSYATNAKLTNYQYGQYRNRSLTDSSVFDFYNKLIDGDTKKEFENWDAYNVDLSQTAFDDRLGVQLSYDRQKYKRGGEALLGNPAIDIDVLQNFQDYATGPSNTANPNVANPNFGRPFVAGGPGRGNSYDSDREYVRGSLFGELRARDFTKSEFLTKLLGKHRFNGVYSNETYNVETRNWQMYANSAAYAAYKLQGNPDGIINLPPTAVIYLGPSLASANSAAGANISNINGNVTLPDGNIYQFASTWAPQPGVLFSDPWNVPPSLQNVFNGAPYTNPTTGAPYPQLTQASNPANYVGWNSTFKDTLLRYADGADPTLVTAAAKTERVTKSWAGSWQGYLWNDAIVPTLGWRYDVVKTRGVSASPIPGSAARGALNLDPTVYTLPAAFPTNTIVKDHSTSGSLVVHLNKLFSKDPLPINVSLSYNKSSNFSVVNIRRDIFGNTIGNPTGSTKDYGVLLSTKDGKYSFRAVKYETNQTGVDTTLDRSGITNTIVSAMNWRNIKTYYMSGYAWSTAGQTNLNHYTGQRYLWDAVQVDNTTGRPVGPGTPGFTPVANSHLETQAEADTRRDLSIKAINDFQTYLTGQGYFAAWNYGVGPTTGAALQTRGQYEASPINPDPASVYDYRTAPAMQGFQVTADAASKGYEFEFTANPLPNWRVSFNASQTTAVRTNVGGAVLDGLIAKMDALMAGPGGDLVQFNSDYSAGNELRFGYNGWRGQYTLLKLQEGAAASELRKWRYNVITNYTFVTGKLKGFGVGAAYRWQDKVVIGYPVIPGTGGLASFDLSKPYYGPSEAGLDLWVSYERKLTKKIDWKIQANVRNVGQNNDLIPISVEPDGRTWAAVRLSPTQEWFVTNTFSF
jgi:hypothetical protein